MMYLGQVAVLQALLNIDKQRTLGTLRVAALRMQLPQAGLLMGLIRLVTAV